MRSASGVAPAGAIVDHRVLGPAVPQPLDHRHELFALGVAVVVADLAGAAEVARRRRQPRRDDVPADAAVADVIERAELPRQIERLGVGGGCGRDQPDPAGHRRNRRQHRDGLKPGARGLRRVVAERELVGQEDGIEQPGLRPLRQILVVADVGQRQRRRQRMPPRRLVVAAAVDEQVEMQLPLHGVILGLYWRRLILTRLATAWKVLRCSAKLM